MDRSPAPNAPPLRPSQVFVQHGTDIHSYIQHTASGQIFPAVVSGFLRVSTLVYDRTGNDVSAGYDYGDMHLPIVGTVYVFPAPTDIVSGASADTGAASRAEFLHQKQAIALSHPDARLLHEEPATLPQPGLTLQGWHASYNFTEAFNGSLVPRLPVVQPVQSDLFVFCCVRQHWALEYRFTYPVHENGQTYLDRFMQSLPINIISP
jgi:hypothetical protein